MMCCVANFWSWRDLVGWGWNILAEVLSRLVGVSGKCSASCVGGLFSSASEELLAHPPMSLELEPDGGFRSELTFGA